MGSGSSTNKISSIGIVAESLRALNLVADNPMEFELKNYNLIVPEPSAYVLHKLFINLSRSEEKQKKDIRAVRELLPLIQASERDYLCLKRIYSDLPNKYQKVI